MLFQSLADKYLDNEMKPDIEKLFDLKRSSPELGEGQRLDRVNRYIERSVQEIESAIALLPVRHQNGWEELNSVFLSLL